NGNDARATRSGSERGTCSSVVGEVLGFGGRAVVPAVPYGMRNRVDVLQIHHDGGEREGHRGRQGRAMRVRAVVSTGAVLMLRPVLMLR
ncbi:MAG: hypothetical protein ACE5HT_17105, partial [Gemmatimonadales bacterium]